MFGLRLMRLVTTVCLICLCGQTVVVMRLISYALNDIRFFPTRTVRCTWCLLRYGHLIPGRDSVECDR
jgi:hypothetical protein